MQTMTTEELELWLAFERLEGPLGPERDDLHAVQTSATVANMFRRQGSPAINPVDLVPDWSGERKEARINRNIEAWMQFGKRMTEEGNRG
jgi:hypothetical protein